MRLLEIDLLKISKPEDVLNIQELSNLSAGDKIVFRNIKERDLVLFVTVVAVAIAIDRLINKQNRIDFGEAIIARTLKNKSLNDLVEEIESCGIEVEMEDEEHDFWMKVGKEDFLQKAWDADEDFSHLVIKELNPDYFKK